MTIRIMQWCVEIRMLSRKPKVRYREIILLTTVRPLFSCSSGFHFVFIMLVLQGPEGVIPAIILP